MLRADGNYKRPVFKNHAMWLGNVCSRISLFISSGGATPARTRSNDLAGRSTALAPPCLLLCFGNLTAASAACVGVESDVWPLKRSTFWEKSAPQRKSWLPPDSGWPGLRIFWPRNQRHYPVIYHTTSRHQQRFRPLVSIPWFFKISDNWVSANTLNDAKTGMIGKSLLCFLFLYLLAFTVAGPRLW